LYHHLCFFKDLYGCFAGVIAEPIGIFNACRVMVVFNDEKASTHLSNTILDRFAEGELDLHTLHRATFNGGLYHHLCSIDAVLG